MTHTFKIKEAAKSKPVKTLLSEAEMIAQVKKAEKGKKIQWDEAKKIIEKW